MPVFLAGASSLIDSGFLHAIIQLESVEQKDFGGDYPGHHLPLWCYRHLDRPIGSSGLAYMPNCYIPQGSLLIASGNRLPFLCQA